MSDIITTLHPENDAEMNLYPNIKKENIPDGSINRDKLGTDVNELLNNIGELHPSGVDTSSNILSKTSNEGIWVGSDTGKWYYWNGTQYVEGGVYQAAVHSGLNTWFTSAMVIDLNNYIDDGNYVLGGINNNSSNIPASIDKSKTYLFQITKEYFSNNSTYIITQVITSLNADIVVIYTRQCQHINNADTWTNWKVILNDNNVSQYVDYNSLNAKNNTWIVSNTSIDFNDYKTIGKYVLGGINRNSSNYPSNIDKTKNYLFEIFKNIYLNNSNYIVSQKLTSINDDILTIYTRQYINSLGTWGEWASNVATVRSVVEIGSNKAFTTLLGGFDYAYNKGNCDVYIDEGEYDLISEGVIQAHNKGLLVGKNNRYFFSSKSKVVCHYTGSDNNVMANFSCFISNYNYGDFEFHNCTIEASKIRYCFHDEMGADVVTIPYKHVFDGCIMEIDNYYNSANDGAFYHCIGGGLGYAGNIIINNCIFNSKRAYNDLPIYADVSYHGNYSSSDISKNGTAHLKITNCYFTHAMQISAPNNETAKKKILFANNSYNSNETTDGLYYNQTSNDYWDAYAWGNHNRYN